MNENKYIEIRNTYKIRNNEPNLEIIKINNSGYDFLENQGKKSIPEIKIQNLEDIPEQIKILNNYIKEITFIKND